jgi:hypothetical protein
MSKLVSAASGAIEKAKNLFERLLGPAADEAGAILRDSLRVYRLKNLIRVLEKTQVILDAASQRPNPIPLRLLMPAIERASLEDNETLASLWAALLANASSGRTAVHPSFPTILAEIAPDEARLLVCISKEEGRKWRQFRTAMAAEFKLSEEAVNEMYGNLQRLELCAISSDDSDPDGGGKIVLVAFGRRFLKAVTTLERQPQAGDTIVVE